MQKGFRVWINQAEKQTKKLARKLTEKNGDWEKEKAKSFIGFEAESLRTRSK